MKRNNNLKDPSKRYINLVNEGYLSHGLFPRKKKLRANRKDLYDYWRSDFLKRGQYDKRLNRLMNS